MRLFIQRGADLEKKTELNSLTPLGLAVGQTHVEAVETLLKYGAIIDGKSYSWGEKPLEMASKSDVFPGNDKIISVLFKYGADINDLNRNGKTALQNAHPYETKTILRTIYINKYMLVKEVARLKFEDRYICQENLDYLQQQETVQKHFKNCLSELQRLKSINFYNDISLYNVLQMRSHEKKLISLTRNEDFVAAYELSREKESFEYYGEELDDMLEHAVKKRDILMAEEQKLYSILKNYFPELIIRNVAYFSIECL